MLIHIVLVIIVIIVLVVISLSRLKIDKVTFGPWAFHLVYA